MSQFLSRISPHSQPVAAPLSVMQLPETFLSSTDFSGSRFLSGDCQMSPRTHTHTHTQTHTTRTPCAGPLLWHFPYSERGPVFFLKVAFKTGVIGAASLLRLNWSQGPWLEDGHVMLVDKCLSCYWLSSCAGMNGPLVAGSACVARYQLFASRTLSSRWVNTKLSCRLKTRTSLWSPWRQMLMDRFVSKRNQGPTKSRYDGFVLLNIFGKKWWFLKGLLPAQMGSRRSISIPNFLLWNLHIPACHS